MSAYADNPPSLATVICMDYDGYGYQDTILTITILNLSCEDIIKHTRDYSS